MGTTQKSVTLTLTERAGEEVKKFLAEEKVSQESAGLRVAVLPGGCSGFRYSLNIEEQPAADDVLAQVLRGIDSASDDMAACVVTVESKRATRAFRLEELELQAHELDEDFARRFLEACQARGGQIADAVMSLRTTAGEFGAAVLRVRMETGETTVTVASPRGATTELPLLQPERLAAPIDL